MRQPSRSAPLIRRFAACLFPFAASCANELVGPNSTTVPIAVRSVPNGATSLLSFTARNASVRTFTVSGCPGVPTYQVQTYVGSTWYDVNGAVNGICLAIYTSITADFPPGAALSGQTSVTAGTYRVLVFFRDPSTGSEVRVASPALSVP